MGRPTSSLSFSEILSYFAPWDKGFFLPRLLLQSKTRPPPVWAEGRVRFWAQPAACYFRCQMSWLYSAMVRSLEKKPLLAMFTSIFCAQAERLP